MLTEHLDSKPVHRCIPESIPAFAFAAAHHGVVSHTRLIDRGQVGLEPAGLFPTSSPPSYTPRH